MSTIFAQHARSICSLRRGLTDALVLCLITGYLVSVFEPRYLFLKTITAGGDTASHYYTASYLREYLLPHGQITGWTQGNLAGFPILQFYFPLPFLMMAGLSMALPLEIAFKIVTVLGTFLMPVAAYVMLRLMRCRFPVPSIGAAASLLFLFNEGNSMWGGNIPSTLAGEFSYSLSMAFGLIFLGSLYRDMRYKGGSHWMSNALLVFLIGFSHGYPLLYVGVVSLFFLATEPRLLFTVAYLFRVYGSAFFLLGFWIVPLLVFSSYTIPYNIVWAIPRVREIIPAVMAPAAATALCGTLVMVAHRLVKARAQDSEDLFGKTLFLWWALAASVPLYLVAQHIGVVDIRFVPFGQLALVLLAAPALSVMFRWLKAQSAFAVATTIAAMLWTDACQRSIPQWIKWNYEGFERKAAWPQFEAITSFLQGTMSEPRVVFEHSPDHDRFGSTRAFESLPLFSNRATLEGVYHQASLSSPFVFYIQSEVSKVASCPFPQYSYAHLDLSAALDDLKLFNVGQYIVKSKEAKAAAKKTPGYRLEKAYGEYEIYRVETNENRYVVPLAFKPVLADMDNYKRLAYQWFLERKVRDVPIVFADTSAYQGQRFAGVLRGLKDMPFERVGESGCSVQESIGNDQIEIKTDCIGRPLLVKVSYHPNWKVEGADRVYLASPSFMLIYPERGEVRLHYGRSLPDYVGLAMSVFAVVTLLGMKVFRPSFSRMEVEVSRRAIFSARRRTIAIVTSSIVTTVCCVFLFQSKQQTPMKRFNRAIVFKDKGRYQDARQIFERLYTRDPASSLAMDSLYYIAITYYLEKRYDKAQETFQEIVDQFPSSHWVPEAQYHIGLCHLARGDAAAATKAFESVVANYVGTIWHTYAQEQLGRLKASPHETLERVALDRLYNEAIRLFNADRCEESKPLLKKIFEGHREYQGAPQALACYALCFFKEGRCQETVTYYSLLLERYPDHRLAWEAQEHIERCRLIMEK